MEENKNTHHLIEQVALDLFSQKGFKSVSIRDICKLVGIKESTVYYHFKNKQAIMDSLLVKIDLLVEDMKVKFNHEFTKVLEIPEEAMCDVAVGILINYLLNPYVYKMISVLTIERMSDDNASKIYQKIVFDLPLNQQEQVFSQMIAKGFIKDNSPHILAQEYYSIIYLAFQKNCIGGELTEEKKNQACYEIRENMSDIYRKMR